MMIDRGPERSRDEALDVAVTVTLTDVPAEVDGESRAVFAATNVPFVDLKSLHVSLRAEIDQAVTGVLDRGDFILGQAVSEFEDAFAAYCGVAHAVGVDSGFSGLELALRAHDIGPGDEVITAANTFIATVAAIEACGASPVLVDVNPHTSNIDPEKVAAAITPMTRAIIPVHLYGRVAPMSELAEIARAHDLILIEDACQAHGARLLGKRAGALGDAAAFSFYPSKNLGALGDGGMVVTDDASIAKRVRMLRNLGSEVKYYHTLRGFNRRLDTLHAAVLGVKLPWLDIHNESRCRTARLYDEAMTDLPVQLPARANPGEHVYHLYVIETDERDALQNRLTANAIGSGIHYPVPIHLQPAYTSLGQQGAFPVAERLAQRILSLPMYPGMTSESVGRVVTAVRSFYSD